MNRSLRFYCLVVLALACQIGASSANAEAADEPSIRKELASPTELEFEYYPLPEVLEYLADYHHISISLDHVEIKRIGIDLPHCDVTKKTNGRLDDTLTEILGPFNLSFMIEDNKLLITSQLKAREWQEKYATSIGRAR